MVGCFWLDWLSPRDGIPREEGGVGISDPTRVPLVSFWMPGAAAGPLLYAVILEVVYDPPFAPLRPEAGCELGIPE